MDDHLILDNHLDKNIRVQRGQVILFQSQFNQVAQMRETSRMHHCDVVPVQVEFIQEVQSFPEFPPDGVEPVVLKMKDA